MASRFVLLASGIAILALAAALLRHDDEGWFVLSLGVGVIVMSALPSRSSAAPRTTRAVVAVLVLAFVAVRSAQLVRSGADSSDLLAFGAETAILTLALVLLRAHLYGIGRLVASLLQPGQELGYARILRLDEAAGVIESEFARSRRRGDQLVLIELEGQPDLDGGGASAQKYVGPRSIRYLESVFLHVWLGALLTQHARRSDVVISEREGRYIVLSPETDLQGALAMSQRVGHAARSQLRMTLKVGMASFPDDGESLRELLTVASRRASTAVEPTTAMPDAAPIAKPVPTPTVTHPRVMTP